MQTPPPAPAPFPRRASFAKTACAVPGGCQCRLGTCDLLAPRVSLAHVRRARCPSAPPVHVCTLLASSPGCRSAVGLIVSTGRGTTIKDRASRRAGAAREVPLSHRTGGLALLRRCRRLAWPA
eukprot:358464-Chlamydomonas_euryale.AAC.3